MIARAHFKPASTLVSQLKQGKISSEALLDVFLERVDKHNSKLNAVVWQDTDAARKAAKAADAAYARGEIIGPLHGLPMTLKEAHDIAGVPTTNGNPKLKDNVAQTDSVVMAKLRAAGAIVFGKTNLPIDMADWQSFNEIHGTTNNPWKLNRTPGGSSGGAAVALATGMTPAEVGSDIGSSIRNPAHFTGVFGLKPSWGILALRGHGAPGNWVPTDIAVVGPMTRSARDLDLLLDVLVSPDPLDAPAWQVNLPKCNKKNLSEFKVALKLNDKNARIDDQYAGQLQNFADQLAAAGATVVEAEPDIDTSRIHEVYLRLLRAATSAGIKEEALDQWRAKRDSPEAAANQRYMNAVVDGYALTHRDWLLLDNERRQLREKFASFFDEYDILLCPAAMSAAWLQNQRGERWERMIEVNDQQVPDTDQLFWSGYSGVVYLPSTVGPCGSVDGLPVGYQAIAGFGRDKTATAFSRAAEKEIMKFKPPRGYR